MVVPFSARQAPRSCDLNLAGGGRLPRENRPGWSFPLLFTKSSELESSVKKNRGSEPDSCGLGPALAVIGGK
jgi:hypothetical protein